MQVKRSTWWKYKKIYIETESGVKIIKKRAQSSKSLSSQSTTMTRRSVVVWLIPITKYNNNLWCLGVVWCFFFTMQRVVLMVITIIGLQLSRQEKKGSRARESNHWRWERLKLLQFFLTTSHIRHCAELRIFYIFSHTYFMARADDIFHVRLETLLNSFYWKYSIKNERISCEIISNVCQSSSMEEKNQSHERDRLTDFHLSTKAYSYDSNRVDFLNLSQTCTFTDVLRWNNERWNWSIESFQVTQYVISMF